MLFGLAVGPTGTGLPTSDARAWDDSIVNLALTTVAATLSAALYRAVTERR